MTFQMHSVDLRVRLKSEPLASIVFEHLCTVQDLSILDDSPMAERAPVSAGLTEWEALVDGRRVSLGWDWVCLQDGAFVVDPSVPPRTNLLLIDSWGYDRPGADTTAVLWQVIGAMEWQPAAAAEVQQLTV